MEDWEIKNRLEDGIREICTRYLPGGSFDGRYYRAGGVHGGAGDSLVVHLDGDKKGKFFENAPKGDETFTSGNALDLIMAACNLSDYKDGINEAAKFLSVSRTRPEFFKYSSMARAPQGNSTPQENRQAPAKLEDIKPINETWPLKSDGDVYDYLTNTRQIPPEILKRYEVTEGVFTFRVREKDSNEPSYKKLAGYAFKFLSADKTVRMGTKYFALERDPDGHKRLYSDRGMTAENYHLWGMWTIPAGADELVICEGEIDAMSVAALGYNAVSIPFGAKADSDGALNSGNAWITNDWEWLSRFKDIKILMDNDEAGRAAAQTLMNRLNLYRTKLVEIPESDFGKDANDLLCNNEPMLKEVIDNARAMDPEQLVHLGDLKGEVKNLFFPPDGKEPGRVLPWTLPPNAMNVRDGEVTVVSGYSKHGKTTLLNWVCVNFANTYNDKIFLGSFEILPELTAQTLWRQCMGRYRPVDDMNRPDMNAFNIGLDWLDRHFFAYKSVGRVNTEKLLDVMAYAAQRYGVKIFVLDSLMKCGIRKDDLNAQSEFVDKLDVFAKQYRCHVFLVAHAKKVQNKDNSRKKIINPEDVEGSGDITNLACNLWIVQRNFEKEEKLQKLRYSVSNAASEDRRAELEAEIDTVMHKADAIWSVRIQRQGGKTPEKYLYFDDNSWSYSEDYGFTPKQIA